jgi:hypothetical protein
LSEGATFGIGLALGLLIVVTVLVVKRDEVGRSVRLYRSGQSDASVGSSPRPSRGAMAFGSLGGAVSIIAGLPSGSGFLSLQALCFLPLSLCKWLWSHASVVDRAENRW